MSHAKKNMISFFLTTKCNIDCSYCYIGSKGLRHRLNIDFAKAGIIDFFSSQQSRHIRFYGAGEPTVEFDLMKEIYNFALTASPEIPITSEIQTNGVFSDVIREWLQKHIDIIWVSCDGPPDIQDHYRYATNHKKISHIVEKNIRALTSGGRAMTGARMTITSGVVGRQRECIDYFRSIGVKNVWADPIFPSVGDNSFVDRIDWKMYLDEFVETVEYAKHLGMFYGSILTCNFDEETDIHCRACLPAPHLTTDGYISACDMALFGEGAPHMSCFIYGKWDEKGGRIIYDQEKIKLLRSRTVANMSECIECSAKKNCAGYCLGEVANETGDLFGKKITACNAIQYLSNRMEKNVGCYKWLHP